MPMTKPQQHDPSVDKDGNDVSDFVAEAVSALRADPTIGRVICDYYQTGRIQAFFVQKYVPGDFVRLAREQGYQLDFATTRSGETQSYPSWKTIGYAELIPQENDRDRESEFRYK